MRPLNTESSNSGDHENDLFYQRPGFISNLLLIDQKSGCLLPDLQEHFDFITVPFSVWEALQSWYGCDKKICRRLVQDPFSLQLQLDTYPEQHSIQQVVAQGQGLLTVPDRLKIFSELSYSSMQSCDFVEGKQLDF